MPGKLTLVICELIKSSSVLYGRYCLCTNGINSSHTSGKNQFTDVLITNYCDKEFNSISVNSLFYIVFIKPNERKSTFEYVYICCWTHCYHIERADHMFSLYSFTKPINTLTKNYTSISN